ncbi:MAG: Na(+)/H(+) antiporter subunit B [Chromatocurvus sp.]
MIEWVLDAFLITALLSTSVAALCSRDLFRAVVVFIAFGLLMALAWVRLRAPDIALAEAAIGAGLTGVLLLDAARHLGRAADPGGDSSRTWE